MNKRQFTLRMPGEDIARIVADELSEAYPDCVSTSTGRTLRTEVKPQLAWYAAVEMLNKLRYN